jgi:hypothetical protein
MTLGRSIPTRYNGQLYRSNLEADWARAFDTLGVEFQYELEGRYFGDTFYLPDFWLPKSRQFVEVKGVFQPADCRKIVALLNHIPAREHTDENCPDIAIVACEPLGVFRGWERGAVRPDADILEMSRKACHDLRLFACAICAGFWFADDSLSWKCQCCGYAAGNGHIACDIGSPLPNFPDLSAIRAMAFDDAQFHHD